MDHSYFKERISAYADNALPPYEQMAVQEHLESCPECRAAFEKILKLTAWIDSEANLAGDEYFELQAQKIEARLGLAQTEVTPLRKRSWQGLGWKLTTVAASIALVGIVVYLSKNTVLQKSDTPVLNAPAIQDEKKSDDAKPTEKFELKSIQPETTAGKGVAEPKPGDYAQKRSVQEKSVSEEKPIPSGVESNYKTSPQMLAPADMAVDTTASDAGQRSQPIQAPQPAGRNEMKLESAAGKAVESTVVRVKGKRDVISKFQVSGQSSKAAEQIKTQPVQKVDDLLKSVAGVKADSSGGVIIRGGRAGEVSYIVDSVPMTDSIHQSPVKIEPDVLTYWYTVCDSLEKERQDKSVVDKVISQVNRTVQKETAPILFSDRPPEPRVTLAEAYFRIAKISRDSTEIARVTDSLKSIAADPKSPDRTQAKAYLDSLGVR